MTASRNQGGPTPRCPLRRQQRATAEGIPLKGSFYWSAMDNLEWTAAFGTRFGLVYVELRSTFLRSRVKSPGYNTPQAQKRRDRR